MLRKKDNPMPEPSHPDADRDLLADRAVIVTGAGRGPGEAFARHAAACGARVIVDDVDRSEEHTSELQSLMRISYAVFCLKKKKYNTKHNTRHNLYDVHIVN